MRVRVNTAGGVITEWELKDYREADKTPVGLGVLYKKIMGQGPKRRNRKRSLATCSFFPCTRESTGRTWSCR